jgi:LuxR family transcriptional regulator, quorum-sensing system regulator BjaR1
MDLPIGVIQISGAIENAASPAQCTKVFLEGVKPLGVDTLAAGEVDLARENFKVFFAIAWPEEWRRFYFEDGVYERDVLVASLPHYGSTPFTWTDLRKHGRLDEVGSKALRLAAELGWREGLVVPIPKGGGRWGLVSLVAKREGFTEEEVAIISLLGLCYYERLRLLAPSHGFPIPPMGLTAREIGCLQLASRGCHDRGIAAKLGISHSTAKEYLDNARRKLCAATRVEAVAVAVSLAIIAR